VTTIALNDVIPGWDESSETPMGVTAERSIQHTRLDHDLLLRAYKFSEKAHRGQKRLSGEDFVSLKEGHEIADWGLLIEDCYDRATCRTRASSLLAAATANASSLIW
jgi:hypothetical protein